MKISELQSKNPELYNTDKFGTSLYWRSHAYDKFYDEFFLNKRDSNLSLLEIGMYFGGSIKLFHDYLINSNISGIDINDLWKNGNVNDFNRLQRYFFNAYDLSNWNNLKINKFDIIIDDGPHTYDSQLFALNNFYDKLNDGGTLIIEDVEFRNLDKLVNNYKHDKNKIKVYDWSSLTNMNDDILIVINK